MWLGWLPRSCQLLLCWKTKSLFDHTRSNDSSMLSYKFHVFAHKEKISGLFVCTLNEIDFHGYILG